MTKILRNYVPAASSRMGRYVPAPKVQRLTPPRQTTKYRNWTMVDTRSVLSGDVLAVFGPRMTAASLFDRVSTGRPGRPRVNPELLARLVLTGAILNLSYRRLEGFGRSIAKLLGVDPELAPDHTTINKWMSETHYTVMRKWIRATLNIKQPPIISVAIDATGLAIRTSGGWAVDKPGGSGKRLGKYDKWHVVCDTQTGFVIEHTLTRSHGPGSGDPVAGKELLKQVLNKHPNIETVCADGAYPSKYIFTICAQTDTNLLVPLPAKAKYTGLTNRDMLLTQQSRIGRRVWKQKSGYHQRSQIENVFAVTKTQWGNKLKAKTIHNRETEITLQVEWRNHAICESLKT